MEGRVFVERRETGKVYYGGCGHEPVSLDEVRYPGGREQAIERAQAYIDRHFDGMPEIGFNVGLRAELVLAAAEGRETC